MADDHRKYQPFVVGGGLVTPTGGAVRLAIPPTAARSYADAQMDDYHGLRRSHFRWKPPVRLRVRARMSHPASQAANDHGLRGTAGFGFWNDPFTLTGGGVLAAPSAVWFFYASPPADMRLVEGVPGWGWKAATLDSARVPALLLAPAALGAVLLTQIPRLGRPIIRLARRAMRAHEAVLEVPLTEWHDYEIDWGQGAAVFKVDGSEALRAPDPPRGPLGFVAWVDNQYAIATPEGRFGFGVSATPEAQWLELSRVELGPGQPEEFG